MLFSEEAVADRWLRDCPQGGFVLGFASHNPQEQVEPDDRGRVLGLYEFLSEKLLASDPDAIDPAWLDDPRLKNAEGRFRWPYGFKAIRAWRFVKRNVMTRETLPNARGRSFILTRDMLPIDPGDRGYANQYLMEEVQVYRRPFRPLQLGEPNAIPDHNYLLVSRDAGVLRRIPQWREGDILYKPGIASDLDGRLGDFNNHAVSRIFGLKLHRVWQQQAPSASIARERELAMLAVGERLCRLAAPDQCEFFFGPESALVQFIAAGGGVKRVA